MLSVPQASVGPMLVTWSAPRGLSVSRAPRSSVCWPPAAPSGHARPVPARGQTSRSALSESLARTYKTLIQSDCGPEMEGISCDYGSTLCCGETFPEMVLTCMGGSWEGYYIDTPCILFPGHTSKMASHTAIEGQKHV